MTEPSADPRPPVPWSKGTGKHGLYCGRLVHQHGAGKTRMLLPLTFIPDQEEPPATGDRILILTAPVRGLPFTIAKVEFCSLDELTDYHLREIGQDRASYLSRWDECNPNAVAASNPDIMLLWLVPGWSD